MLILISIFLLKNLSLSCSYILISIREEVIVLKLQEIILALNHKVIIFISLFNNSTFIIFKLLLLLAPCGTQPASEPQITLVGGQLFYVLLQQNLNHYNPGWPG